MTVLFLKYRWQFYLKTVPVYRVSREDFSLIIAFVLLNIFEVSFFNYSIDFCAMVKIFFYFNSFIQKKKKI